MACMYVATDSIDLSNYLVDELHLTEEGHVIFAREIFYGPRGLIKNDSSYGLERKVGYMSTETR